MAEELIERIFLFMRHRPDEWFESGYLAMIFGIKDDSATRARTRAIMQKVKVYAGKRGEVVASGVNGYAMLNDADAIKAYRNNMRARAAAIHKHIVTCNKALRSRGQRLLAEL